MLLILLSSYSIKAILSESHNCREERLMGTSTPRLERRGRVKQLIVGEEPFLVLGGELHNSSSSSTAYMKPIWPRLKALNLNTVLASVSWEMIEPVEGDWDFSIVDDLIANARIYGLRLIIIYFGTWKNATSSYVPAWVKRDTTRFFRARNAEGQELHTISALCSEAKRLDARAFGRLMAHIAEVDGREGTVLMAQVENEVGILGTPRDMCDAANDAFRDAVPAKLVTYLKAHKEDLLEEISGIWRKQGCAETGHWEHVFGDGAAEVFMAWHTAQFVEAVAAAGKSEHPIPLFANAWLAPDVEPQPGTYPSGGPVSRMLDVWRAAAPTIEFLAPDIYASGFREVCASYTRGGNPLFIPEARKDRRAASTSLYAFGKHAAMGFCPFAIDDVGPEHPLAEVFGFLKNARALLTSAQQEGRCTAFLQQHDHEIQTEKLDGICIRATTIKALDEGAVPGGALVVALGGGAFLVAGRNMNVSFHATQTDDSPLEFLRCEEGIFDGGKWIPGRLLNGDETRHGLLARLGNPLGVLRLTVNPVKNMGEHIEFEIQE